MDGSQRGLASVFYKCFKNKKIKWKNKKYASLTDKSASTGAVKNENISDEEFAEELHKPIIRKLEKGKVHSSFIDKRC